MTVQQLDGQPDRILFVLKIIWLMHLPFQRSGREEGEGRHRRQCPASAGEFATAVTWAGSEEAMIKADGHQENGIKTEVFPVRKRKQRCRSPAMSSRTAAPLCVYVCKKSENT